MRTQGLLIALLATATLVGCKKTSEDPPVDKAGTTATALANADEYRAKGGALNAKLLEVFKETDCDKLATALSHMIDANKADTSRASSRRGPFATNGWEKAHPDDRKAFEEATAKDLEAVTGAAVDRCKHSPQFQTAMAKLATD